jgi:hypothetical protein
LLLVDAEAVSPRRRAQAWFDTPATVVGQPAAADKSDRQLQFFLGHIEECVGGDGYSVGGNISLGETPGRASRLLSPVPTRSVEVKPLTLSINYAGRSGRHNLQQTGRDCRRRGLARGDHGQHRGRLCCDCQVRARRMHVSVFVSVQRCSE